MLRYHALSVVAMSRYENQNDIISIANNLMSAVNGRTGVTDCQSSYVSSATRRQPPEYLVPDLLKNFNYAMKGHAMLTVPFWMYACIATVRSFEMQAECDMGPTSSPTMNVFDDEWLEKSSGLAAMLFCKKHELQSCKLAVGRLSNEIRRKAFQKWLGYARHHVFKSTDDSAKVLNKSPIERLEWLDSMEDNKFDDTWNRCRLFLERVEVKDKAYKIAEIKQLENTPGTRTVRDIPAQQIMGFCYKLSNVLTDVRSKARYLLRYHLLVAEWMEIMRSLKQEL